MNTARKDVAPAYLRLVRDGALVAAVAAFDERLDRTPEPLSPVASAVQAGTVEKFVDPISTRPKTCWVLRLVGGDEVTVMAPMRLDTSNFANAVEVMMETALTEADPAAGLTDEG